MTSTGASFFCLCSQKVQLKAQNDEDVFSWWDQFRVILVHVMLSYVKGCDVCVVNSKKAVTVLDEIQCQMQSRYKVKQTNSPIFMAHQTRIIHGAGARSLLSQVKTSELAKIQLPLLESIVKTQLFPMIWKESSIERELLRCRITLLLWVQESRILQRTWCLKTTCYLRPVHSLLQR